MSAPCAPHEFGLRFEPLDDCGRFAVRVVASPFGSGARTTADLSFCWDDQIVDSLESELRRPVGPGLFAQPAEPSGQAFGRESVSPVHFGSRLFHQVFSGEVLEAFMLSLGQAESGGSGLRLRLHLSREVPRLAAVPWELIYRSQTGDFLARSRSTPLVRQLEVQRRFRVPEGANRKILVVLANPRDQRHELDLARERDHIADALADCGSEIICVERATLSSLRKRLAFDRYEVLHFMGHGDFDTGTGEGALVFEGDDGKSVFVRGRVLAEVLKGGNCPAFVFLNSCRAAQMTRRRGLDPFSGVASALILAGVPAVLAMQYPVSDQVALEASKTLYGLLSSGWPVDLATAEARAHLHLAFPRSWEWVTPALYLCSGSELHLSRGPVMGLRDRHSEESTSIALLQRSLERAAALSASAARLELERRLPAMREDEVQELVTATALELRLRDYRGAEARLAQVRAVARSAPTSSLLTALCLFRGRRPWEIPLTEILKIDFELATATVNESAAPSADALRLAIRVDFFRRRGLRCPSPSIETLIARYRDDSLQRAMRALSSYVDFPGSLLDLLS